MSASLNVGEVLDRVKQVAGVQTDADLARFFGKFKTAASNWRSRGTVPLNEIVELAETHNVSLDWILTGRGGKEVMGAGELATTEAAPEPYAAPGENFNARLARLRQISEWLQEIEREDGLQSVEVSVIMEMAFKHRLDKEGVRRIYQLAVDDNFRGRK